MAMSVGGSATSRRTRRLIDLAVLSNDSTGPLPVERSNDALAISTPTNEGDFGADMNPSLQCEREGSGDCSGPTTRRPAALAPHDEQASRIKTCPPTDRLPTPAQRREGVCPSSTEEEEKSRYKD